MRALELRAARARIGREPPHRLLHERPAVLARHDERRVDLAPLDLARRLLEVRDVDALVYVKRARYEQDHDELYDREFLLIDRNDLDPGPADDGCVESRVAEEVDANQGSPGFLIARPRATGLIALICAICSAVKARVS